jgi:hypothetical protein
MITHITVKVKRYQPDNIKIARHIFQAFEQHDNRVQKVIGVTNDFDTLVTLLNPYRKQDIQIDYSIDHIQSKEVFDFLIEQLKELAKPNSLQFIYQ